MVNKTIKNNFKKSGVKSLCAIMVAASMMSIAVPAFAETNENVDVCYEAETNLQDELMPLTELPVSVQETVPVEETEFVPEVVPVEEGENVPEDISVAEVLAQILETAPIENEECVQEVANQMETEVPDLTDNEGDNKSEAVSPATTETQNTASDYKPMIDEDRARWIYYEMNGAYDDPEEVTPIETEAQPAPEVPAQPEKEIKVVRLPSNQDLERMNLTDLVRNKKGGWLDSFYDTYRGDGEWRQVGSADMVKFVLRTLSEDDPRYQAFVDFCTHEVYVAPFRG